MFMNLTVDVAICQRSCRLLFLENLEIQYQISEWLRNGYYKRKLLKLLFSNSVMLEKEWQNVCVYY